MQFSPDGSLLATVDGTGQLRIYDAGDGHLLHCLSIGTVPAKVLAFAPDGKTMIAGTNALKEVDAATGKLLRKLASHGDQIDALALSPSGKRVASAGKGKLIVWDLAANEKVYSATPYDVAGLAFVDEAHLLASLGTYPGFKRFDLSAKPPKSGPADVEGPGAFGPVAEGWLTMHLDGSFVIHDSATLARGRTVSIVNATTGRRFATDGADRLVVDERPGTSTALVVDVRSGSVIHRLVAQSPTGLGDAQLHGFAFGPTGQIAACAGRGVTVWNADGTLRLAPRA